MLQKLRKILYPVFTPLNTITVSRKAILYNLNYISKLHKGSDVFPVIKSNAYGHGLREICEILNKSKIHTVCMDSTYEYQVVKKYFKWNMIMLGETHRENYLKMDPKRVALSIYNLSTLKYLVKSGRKFRVHIFINTWMNREGIQEKHIPEFCKIIAGSKLELEWVVSHFSSADERSLSVTKKQIKQFKSMCENIQSYGFDPKYRYMSASGGTLRIQDDYFNAVKPWIACYGYNPVSSKHNLKPALDVYSTVTSIQEIDPEDGVGYNLTYSPKKKTRVASIPFGYTEGLDRRLSSPHPNPLPRGRGNKPVWEVRIGRNYYPVVGRVSMNIVTIEIWDTRVKIWDRVQIISSNPKHKNSIRAMSDAMWTIDYEIIVKLDPSVVREVI